MSESSRHAYVVPIELLPHGNADSLSLVKIQGFTLVVNTEQWKGKSRACFLEPETSVDVTRPEFAFLRRIDKQRDREVITVRKFRGVWSQGLLVPVSEDTPIGTDMWKTLGLEHYEPVEEVGLLTGDCEKAPVHWAGLSKYDLENYRKYSNVLIEGELITISEKVNGSNMSCVYSDGRFWVKSRNFWKKDNDRSDFWRAFHKNYPLNAFLIENPDTLVVGELIGKVKGYTYGLKNGEVEFRAFDMRTKDYLWMDDDKFHEICKENGIKTPQILAFQQPYTDELVLSHVDGTQENNPSGIREGVVIKVLKTRYNERLDGRVALKCVSNAYLEKSSR